MQHQHQTSPIRSSLPRDDQSDLAWFFTEGQVVFDRSTMGLMLDRAALFTFGSRICPECDGEGYTEDMNTALAKAIEQGRKWEASYGRDLATALREYRRAHDNRDPPWFSDGRCRTCHGGGHIPRDSKHRVRRARVSVWPTGSSVGKRGGSEPHSDALERYGAIVRRLDRLPAAHRTTIAAFFGIVGERWDADRHRGRIWAVMALTPAGHTLVRLSREKAENGDERTADEIMSVEAELQELQPEDRRQRLLDAARGQALERLRDAESVWLGRLTRDEAAMARVRARLERLRQERGAA